MLRNEGGVRLWPIRIKFRQPQPLPQGDRKGPHSAPRHTRPYKDYEEGIGYGVSLQDVAGEWQEGERARLPQGYNRVYIALANRVY